MAYLSRVVGLLLLVFAGSAFSSSSDYYFYGNSPWFPTAEAGCASVSPPTPNHVFSHVYIPPGYGDAYWQCFFADTTIPPPNTAQNGGGMKGTCPAGKVADYAAKVCIDPPPVPECSENQELDTETNTCVCKTGPAGSFAVTGDVLTGCNDGCTIVLNSGSYSASADKTYGYWRQNGNTCSPSPELPGVDSPDSPDGQDAGKCPTGQCPGTVNGTFMCVPCKGKETSESSSSDSSSNTPDGASAPDSTTSGSSNSSKQTECADGVCVTKETVTVNNPDGSTTEQSKETTEPQSDYCTKNPKSEICKAAESSWGGDCSSGFQGKGDAVQVATAKAVWESRCALNEGPDQASQDTMDALKTWSMSELNLPDLTITAPTPEAATCPLGDISANFGQFTVPLPLSMLCPYLAVIHKVVTSFGMLMWLLIVFVRGK